MVGPEGIGRPQDLISISWVLIDEMNKKWHGASPPSNP
jgi:hypothetical protein